MNGLNIKTRDIQNMEFPTFKSYEEFKNAIYDTLKLLDCNNIFEANNDVKIGEILGKGAIGEVKKIFIKGITFAVKLIPFRYTLSSSILKDILNEILTLKSSQHQGIIKFQGLYIEEKQLGLIFDYIDGKNLKESLPEMKYMTKLDKTKLIIKIVEIIVYLHSKKMIHRDIKPSNIMINKDNEIFLVDFGLSRLNKNTQSTVQAGDGTPRYAAPESVSDDKNDNGHLTVKYDVWSLGCLIMELFSGEAPWGMYQDPIKILVFLGELGESPDKIFPI